MRRLALILVGCSSSPAPEPVAQTPAPNVTVAAKQPWVECTEPYRVKLEAGLNKRHGLDRGDAAIDRTAAPSGAADGRSEAPTIDGARCLTISLDHQPAFYVELVGVDDRAAHRKLRGVVALDATTELVELHDAELDWAQLEGGQASFEALDLDGDGTDELIAHRSDDRHALDEWIDVIRVRGKSVRGPRISYDNTRFDPDEIEKCTGKLAQQGRDLVLTTMTSTGKGEHCRPIGTHVFALSADALAER